MDEIHFTFKYYYNRNPQSNPPPGSLEFSCRSFFQNYLSNVIFLQRFKSKILNKLKFPSPA